MSSGPRRRRHSPAVYRRRRLLALILVVVIAAGIVWLLIAQPWQAWAATVASAIDDAASPSATATSDDTPPATPTTAQTPGATPGATPASNPDASPSPSPSPSGTADASGTAKPCVAHDVVVESITDAAAYPAGQNPKLSIKLTNSGPAACTLNVGTSTQSFVITSGSDTWWRSTDCQTEPSDMIVTLTAGQSVSSAVPVVWDRTRSSVSTCGDASRPVAPGGGATYHLTVGVGGITATQDAAFILK